MSTTPNDPLAAMLAMMETMAMLRECYKSATAAGFSEEQAMRIVDTLINAAMQNSKS